MFLAFEIEFSIVISMSGVVHIYIIHSSPCCTEAIFNLFTLFHLCLQKTRFPLIYNNKSMY